MGTLDAQKAMADYLGQHEVEFVDRLDYQRPDFPAEDCWVDFDLLDDCDKERPFAHVKTAGAVRRFIECVKHIDMDNDFFSLSHDGGVQKWLEVRQRRVAVGGGLGPEEELVVPCKCLEMIDGAEVHGLPREWGKTVTVIKLKVMRMKEGCQQL